MLAIHTPQQNRLLAALPATDFAHLQPHLELVRLVSGEALYEPGKNLRCVYFPVTAIVAKLSTMADGATAEIALIGNEGVVGTPLFMGSDSVTNRAAVLNTGYAYRLTQQFVYEEFSRGGALQHVVLRYMQSLIAQIAQNAACNRHHSIRQQLCRWLLLNLDRLASNRIDMTQESIAAMLGVRRESVTEVAGELQHAGLIQYSRGHITVLDRDRLEAHSCERYSALWNECERLLLGGGDRVAPRVRVAQESAAHNSGKDFVRAPVRSGIKSAVQLNC